MFDKKFKFTELEEEFELVLRKDREWRTTKERVLIILQNVPSLSIHNKDILPRGLVRNTVVNTIKLANQQARKLQGKVNYHSYAVVNFNAYRHFHKTRDQRRSDEQLFAGRARNLIKRLKPTKILICGHEAASYLLEESPQDLARMRGRVYRYNDKIPTVVTLDLDTLLAKRCELANLLGFFSRHLTYLLLGKHPFSLRNVYPTVKYVDTKAKFDALFKKLMASKRVAYDTETKDLSNDNLIYTYQFCLDSEPGVGYVIPYDHPTSPLGTKAKQYIKGKLDQFFASDIELITFVGSFDLRVTRVTHNLELINNPIYDITAGEHLLDENTDHLRKADGLLHGNLGATVCRYDNDFYLKASFSKEDRASIGTIAVTDESFLLYCAMDVVSIMHIAHMQERHAAMYEIEGRNYKDIFLRAVRYNLGPAIQQISHLEQDGSTINLEYLESLTKPGSPLIEEIKKAGLAFKKYKSVRTANSNILRRAGIQSNSLFNTGEEWVFSPTKREHKEELFFKVLDLPHVSETASGNPAIDSKFIKEYEKDVKEVATYGSFQKVSKLLSTYVRGWIRILRTNTDSIKDSRLRASYGFFGVMSGRFNSSKPNLQQIPSRGRLANIIKRMFQAPKGRIFIRYDYSAHEVRGWANISGDKILAKSFKTGQALRQEYIVKPTKKRKEELAVKGDVHIQNVIHFFQKVVSRDHPLREAIKSIVFGVLYGKSAPSLGNDIGRDEQYAQELIDKMFDTFKQGGAWLDRMKKSIVKNLIVYSPLGRKRHLYAALTEDRSVIARQTRRGVNAPIQGMSSEIGVIASYLIIRSYYKHANILNSFLKQTQEQRAIKFNRIVHDANYFDVTYEGALLLMHVIQYEATYGVAQYTKEKFGFTMEVEPEIEVEFGVRDDKSYGWDWSLPDLVRCLVLSIKDAEELDLLEHSAKETFNNMWSLYDNTKVQDYLQKHFPLLGVKELKMQINNARKDYLESIKNEDFYLEHKEVVG